MFYLSDTYVGVGIIGGIVPNFSYLDDQKEISFQEIRKRIWQLEMPSGKEFTLARLLETESFSLLAAQLIYIDGIPASSIVIASSKRSVREIRTENKAYREKKGLVFQKRIAS